MICVGIDVAKDKHDCFILSSEGEVLADVFTITNNEEGFNTLLTTIRNCSCPSDKLKVGLEATGHYSYNILGFLLNNGLETYVINPLHTNMYRKCMSLRKTKTDRIDARTIASVLMSDLELRPYTEEDHQNEDLKSLTRYREELVKDRAKMKQSITRLVDILFPELAKLVSNLHSDVVYALLSEFPGAAQVGQAHLTHLTNLLSESSKGHFQKEDAVAIRDAARHSVGSRMPAKSLELVHTIDLIRKMDDAIEEIEHEIDNLMKELNSPITTIPGIGNNLGAAILAEIGDISRYDTPDKVLAFAGMSPSTYQSGKKTNCHAHMEKRGSKHLRRALFLAATYVCRWNPRFKEYLDKKRAEGKHYYVALSHVAKKLVRLIYAMEKSRQPYQRGVV